MQTRTKVWKYKHLFPFYNIWDVKACRGWLFKEILVLRTFLKKRSHEMENGWYVPGFVVLYNLYKNRLHIVILKSLPLLVKCPFFFLNGFSCTLNSNAQCDWLFRADPANPSHHHHHHVGLKHVACCFFLEGATPILTLIRTNIRSNMKDTQDKIQI